MWVYARLTSFTPELWRSHNPDLFTHSWSCLYTTNLYTDTHIQHTHTHILYSEGSWGTTYISSSPVFPAVWGVPGSVYLHDTVFSSGVVDDLWYLAVLHWRTVVISRWAKKEKRRLGPRCRFLGHFLQPFCAVMGVRALRCEKKRKKKAGERLKPAWVHLCTSGHILSFKVQTDL